MKRAIRVKTHLRKGRPVRAHYAFLGGRKWKLRPCGHMGYESDKKCYHCEQLKEEEQ